MSAFGHEADMAALPGPSARFANIVESLDAVAQPI